METTNKKNINDDPSKLVAEKEQKSVEKIVDIKDTKISDDL